LDKPGPFIGKEALMAQQEAGLSKHFVCLEVPGRAIPRAHDILYNQGGSPLGELTSGSISPTLDKPVGVGYVSADVPPAPGTPVWVGIRGRQVEAVIVERPFYQAKAKGSGQYGQAG
jgi:aminomethyltransferase